MELESKFIKGTNEQYSIRNDGVVIRHWFIHSSGTKSLKERIIKGYLDKNSNVLKIGINNKEYLLKTLMSQHFTIINPYNKDVPLIYKDNNPLNCSLNNLYYREPQEKTPLEYYHINNDKYSKRMRGNLPKHYVAATLKMKKEELSEELFVLQTRILRLKRLLNMKN